jgi:hypothetical protein
MNKLIFTLLKLLPKNRLITKPLHLNKKHNNKDFGWERELFKNTPFYKMLSKKKN